MGILRQVGSTSVWCDLACVRKCAPCGIKDKAAQRFIKNTANINYPGV